jgi:hypothetical protein
VKLVPSTVPAIAITAAAALSLAQRLNDHATKQRNARQSATPRFQSFKIRDADFSKIRDVSNLNQHIRTPPATAERGGYTRRIVISECFTR